MGSLSTGLLLFGYSFIYGCAGSLRFDMILAAAEARPDSVLLKTGVLFILASIGFKLTLFPFHMWAPDVYDGAPTPVTGFISVSSKATAIAFLLILLYGPLAPLHQSLQLPLLLLAAATMTVGNLGALKQTRLRRFMAYSSIAQAGYIVMAMAGPAKAAYSSIIYYLLVYAAANYAIFFLMAVVGREREEEFQSFRGMGKKHPGLAAILMLTMFSLGGIPPLAGFMGKFLLFASAAKEGYYFMVVFAALNSTISLYYYLLLVKESYINTPEQPMPVLELSNSQRASLTILTAAMILLGLLPVFSDKIALIV
jgi:NADH-quinone oxidoreductase subunit N